MGSKKQVREKKAKTKLKGKRTKPNLLTKPSLLSGSGGMMGGAGGGGGAMPSTVGTKTALDLPKQDVTNPTKDPNKVPTIEDRKKQDIYQSSLTTVLNAASTLNAKKEDPLKPYFGSFYGEGADKEPAAAPPKEDPLKAYYGKFVGDGGADKEPVAAPPKEDPLKAYYGKFIGDGGADVEPRKVTKTRLGSGMGAGRYG